MSNRIVRQALTAVAAISIVAVGAPLANAQPQAQHRQPQQYSQPQHNQPQYGQQHGAQRNPHQQANRTGRYRIVSTVNLRSGPGTNYRRVGQLRAGRTVQVDQVRSGWLHVRGQGWISAQFARRA